MSDVSSQSGSYYTIGTIETDRFCEEVLDSVSRLQNISLKEQDTPSIVSRSESWSFQGSTTPVVQQSSAYETVVLPSLPFLLSPSRPLDSLSPSSSEIVSSASSSSHPLSPSIQSSEYDNHRLVRQPSSHSYENWDLPRPADEDSSSQSSEFCSSNPRLVHSQSVIFEFDPLFHFVDKLPKPPERVDSICEVQAVDTPHEKETQEQDNKQELEERQGSPSSGKKRLAWTSMKQAIRNLADTSVRRSSKTSECLLSKDKDVPSLERPTFCIFNTCIYNGSLYKCCGERSKDVVPKYFQLSEGKMCWSNDKNGPNKDLFTLESMLSIKRIPDRRQSSTGEDVYCFQVSTSSPKSKVFVLGASCTSERRIWMQKLIESCTQSFSTKITSNFTRAAWCFLKEGVTNEWSYAWVILQERVLLYAIEGANSVQEVDLKKARSIVCSEADASLPKSTESSQMILVDSPSSVLYLHMVSGLEIRAWAHDMRFAATNSGPLLDDQQLTRDEIPVLVEKCLNFVFAHGSMSEGIYRRSGSNTNVRKLLDEFRQDAWQVQLSREQYSEHDVSTVLKRFFRDLPEPLLSTQLHKHLCNAAGMNCSTEDKVNIYRSLLEKLPPIHYVTVRKLMGHLYFIQEKKERNKMSVENLGAIWGPTLMHVENKDSVEWSQRESLAVADLISLYPKLFHVEEEEIARERQMMHVLERYHISAVVTPQTSNKPSGDLKVWIYLESKDSNQCYNVELDPNKEAGQVCKELSPRVSPYIPPHELCLMEVVCGGDLTRVLHYREKVLSVVLEWGYWDETDRKDNALVLCSNAEWRRIVAPMFKDPQAVCGNLKFADRKSKNFKTYLFEFCQSKLCYYKDKKGSVQLGEWKIEEIIWYLGHEKKRDPETRWSFTFIPRHKTKRSKDSPWFGNTVAGFTNEEKYKWMSAMLFALYGASDLLPKTDLM
ncbi:hypothetical protein WDU94_000840 [Cyamophila willieti]